MAEFQDPSVFTRRQFSQAAQGPTSPFSTLASGASGFAKPDPALSKRFGRDILKLPDGRFGFIKPGTKTRGPNQRSGELFIELDMQGNGIESSIINPQGPFFNVASPELRDMFLTDPDTFDTRNPSGFDPKTFEFLQGLMGKPRPEIDAALDQRQILKQLSGPKAENPFGPVIGMERLTGG